jgi:hypothetical protein
VTPESLEKRLEDFGTKIVSDVVGEVKALLAKAPTVVADVGAVATGVADVAKILPVPGASEVAAVATDVEKVDARVIELLTNLRLATGANEIATVGAWIAEHFA